METDSGLELGNGDRFRPGTWKWRPILAWNLELETDSSLKLGNEDRFRPGTWKWRPIRPGTLISSIPQVRHCCLLFDLVFGAVAPFQRLWFYCF
ncbi:unnamed protein product [Rhizophagus irregularis]|nr:unnamed protein product [Rhizophagus irregularis]